MDVSVRYIVDDVDAAIEFYRDRLGFDVDMHPAPGFARLSRDGLHLLLNAPGAGGAGRAGGEPQPGGWNRFQLTVDDLQAVVDDLEQAGVTFRGSLSRARAAIRSWSKIRPATRSSCSSRRGRVKARCDDLGQGTELAHPDGSADSITRKAQVFRRSCPGHGSARLA